MNVEQLKILHYIVEDGSLKAASHRMSKTQPALSIALKKLEADVGFAIIDRSDYRLKLTAQGSLFYRQAKQVLRDMDRLTTLSDQLAQGDEPEFTILFELACPPSLYLDAFVKTQQQFTATQFNFNSGIRFSSVESVQQNKAHLGIGPWFHIFHSSGDFQTLLLGQYHLVVAASAKLLGGRSSHNLSKLNQYPIITTRESELNFDNEKLSAFKSGSQQCRVTDPETARRLMLNHMGWGLIPKHYIEQDLLNKRLVQLELSDFETEFSGEIRAFRRNDKTHGPVAEFIWQQLKQACDTS